MGLLLAKRFIVKVSFRPSIAVHVLVLLNGISTVVFALPSLAKLLFAHPGDALRLLGGQASSCRFLDFKGVGTTLCSPLPIRSLIFYLKQCQACGRKSIKFDMLK